MQYLIIVLCVCAWGGGGGEFVFLTIVFKIHACRTVCLYLLDFLGTVRIINGKLEICRGLVTLTMVQLKDR